MSRRPIAVAPDRLNIYGGVAPGVTVAPIIIIDHLVTVDGPESAMGRGVTLRLTIEQAQNMVLVLTDLLRQES